MASKQGMEVQSADLTSRLKVLFDTSDGRQTIIQNRKYVCICSCCHPLYAHPQYAPGLLLTDRQGICARYQIKETHESICTTTSPLATASCTKPTMRLAARRPTAKLTMLQATGGPAAARRPRPLRLHSLNRNMSALLRSGRCGRRRRGRPGGRARAARRPPSGRGRGASASSTGT